MNLYFVSLLDQLQKRRNEFAVEYTIYNNGNIRPTEYYSDYLLTRFPYIKNGDLINVIDVNGDVLYGPWFWVNNQPSISYSHNKLFFYKNIERLEDDIDWAVTLDLKRRISDSEVEDKGTFFLINRFKVGNRRYTLKFFVENNSIDDLAENYNFYPVYDGCEQERRITFVYRLELQY
jgi:hypothetical protein